MSRPILIVLTAYVLGFVLFWPNVTLVTDESQYVRAAWSLAHGAAHGTAIDGVTGAAVRVDPSPYLPGTSLLQAPLVAAFGASGARLLSLACYVATGLLLARWLRRQGRSPSFALLFLGYPPALVFGRVAMSDVPSALLVCGAQMMIFESAPSEGRAASARGSWVAGFLAGVSILFRDANAVLVAPLIVGAIVRREGRSVPLVIGGLMGSGLRPLASAAIQGDAFYVTPHRGWSLALALSHLPLDLFALLVMAPLGLVAALAYRGPRRPELLATVLGTFLFFAAFGYAGEESGPLQQLILGTRYFIPLLPILSIALAESAPRVWRLRGEPGGDVLARRLGAGWTALVAALALSIHPVLDRFGRARREISDALANVTTGEGALVLDPVELDKYLVPWRDARRPVAMERLRPEDLPPLVSRDGVAFVALLDRRDSAFHMERGQAAEAWRASAAARCALEPVHDAVHGGMRLRVFRVRVCGVASSVDEEGGENGERAQLRQESLLFGTGVAAPGQRASQRLLEARLESG
jgi:hypothetical protein